jgi:CHAD domain-containing protein
VPQHIERERKYDAEADFAVPDLREVPGCARIGDPVTHTLTATYFDTDDLRLATRGITLRRRRGGEDAGWHLKLPVAENVKREITAPLDAGTAEPPAELTDLVAAHVRGRRLEPIAELETRRTERALIAGNGDVLAELADDDVHARRLRRDAHEVGLVSWREIEIEAVNGSDTTLKAVDRQLRRSGARRATAASKLERTLDDEIAAVRRPTAAETAGDVLLTYVGEQYEQLLSYDPLVRLADHDDDSVHKMRVAVRRIRSLLRTGKRITASLRLAPLDAELKWLADALGEVRDLEVMTARFDAELPGDVRRPAWLAAMADEERRARERLRRTLLSERYYALLGAVDELLAAPPLRARADRPAAKETPKAVARAWRTMAGRYARARRRPAGPQRDAALHSTRKAAKRLRYTAEAAAAALGSAAGVVAHRAERLQDLLGEHHDTVVATQILQNIAERPGIPPADLVVLGRLIEIEHRNAGKLLKKVPSAAKKATKRKPVRKLG